MPITEAIAAQAYALSSFNEPKVPIGIIFPSGTLKQFWDLAIATFTLYSSLTVPIIVIFSVSNPALSAIDYTAIGFFSLDILIR